MLKRGLFSSLAVVALLCAAVSLPACTGTRAAYTAAKSVDETAVVVSEHYYALVDQAAALKETGALAGEALERVQAADRAAKPLVIELTHAIDAYRGVRTATSEEELQAALVRATTAVNNFINALKRRPPPSG